jgi:5'-deoxynucleotidase YfbR-like HD superfamily hydrolase
MTSSRIDQQVAFLTEADQFKLVDRATSLTNASRRENSAEHSWHVALYALILADEAHPDVDISRVIKMFLVHDLVEIDAGDAPIFGQSDAHKLAQEEAAAAATRILAFFHLIKPASYASFGTNLKPPRAPTRNSPNQWTGFSHQIKIWPLEAAHGPNTMSP